MADTLKEFFIKFQGLESELATERASTQQALQTSQTWHEQQKAEIISEWKAKLTNLLNTRKQKITQELNLIREVLNE
jgi:F0F1-type ATP synthase membrane subunit b/b'